MPFLYRKISKTNFHHRGFTMIEVVVVLIVLSIVATVIISKSFTADTNELMVETDGLTSSLQYAQSQSMNDGADTPVIKWGINISDDASYWLYKNNADATSMIPVKGSGSDAVTVACPINCHQLQGNVKISSGINKINFDKWGRPLDGSGNLRTEDTMITLAKGTGTSKFKVSKNTGFIYDVP